MGRIAAATIAATLLGCGLFGSSSKDSTPADGASTETTLYGLVVSSAGAPLAGVDVTAGGKSTVSDASGRFQLTVPGSGTTAVVAELPGYAPTYRSVSPGGSPSASLGVTLYPVSATGTVDGGAGGKVETPAGASVTFPPSSLVLIGSGEPATGPLNVAITYITPAEAFQDSPVPLVGSDGAQTWPLISYGMIDVKVTNAAGIFCQLANGAGAQISLPAAASDPESAGLFYGDPALGYWTLEGAATHTGSVWVGVAPHLSWWNVDAFSKVPQDNRCCVTFYTVSPAGIAVSGVEIKGTIPGGYTFGGNTEVDGKLCHASFPCGELVSGAWRLLSANNYTGPFSVMPSAKGAQCGTVECQTVTIGVPCVVNTQCGTGGKCVDGACQGATPGSDATSGGDTTPGTCVPNCSVGQCSDNGCGQPCSACPTGQTCGPSGLCVSCVPSCSGKICGSDGCNGSCGICPSGETCDGSMCKDPCSFCQGAACAAFGFEDATPLAGWDVSGDVAVITNLGGTSAPEGTHMLRLSTGLSVAQPSYAQRSLCGSVTGTKVQFRWRLYSEEFQEFCGSSYQDDFLVSLVTSGDKTPLYKVTIDEICPAGANGCATCGSASIPIEKSDVAFDKGDVFATPWRQAELALPGGAAGKTIAFQVEDVGDSAYDTVVLIDDVKIVP